MAPAFSKRLGHLVKLGDDIRKYLTDRNDRAL